MFKLKCYLIFLQTDYHFAADDVTVTL